MLIPAVTTDGRHPAKPWSTPQRLRGLRLCLLALDALALLFVLSSVQQTRHSLQRIGREEIPGVVAAQQTEAALSAMDAAFVTEALSPHKGQVALGDAYEARRTEVVHGLIDVAEHMPQGAAERRTVETLEVDLGRYERLLQRAQDLQEQDLQARDHQVRDPRARDPRDQEPRDQEPSAADAVFREAVSVLDRQLLPAAAALDTRSEVELRESYGRARTQSSVLGAFLAITGLLLFLALLVTQSFLSRRTHRTLNLPLLAATLLVAAAGMHLGVMLARAQAELRSGTEAFASVHRLLVARSTALAAFDNDHRALLDASQAVFWHAASGRLADRVATLPPDLTAEQLLAAVREDRTVDGFSGYLAAGRAQQPIAGERGAALATLAAWQRCLASTRQNARRERTGERIGQRPEAVASITATGSTELSTLRREFDHTLEEELSVNQAVSYTSLRQSASAATATALEAAAAALLFAVLVLLGLEPRLREYR